MGISMGGYWQQELLLLNIELLPVYYTMEYMMDMMHLLQDFLNPYE
jgi:hypothetical protein